MYKLKKSEELNDRGFGHLGIIVLIVVVVIVGSIGGFIWKKHSNSSSTIDVHAADIEYKYGRHFQMRDDTRYHRLLVDGYACKWNGSTISVLSIRRGFISLVVYALTQSNNGYARDSFVQTQFLDNWLSNMNLSRFSTYANGHNYMGWNSMRLTGYASLYGSTYGTGASTINLGFTKTLPSCHY